MSDSYRSPIVDRISSYSLPSRSIDEARALAGRLLGTGQGSSDDLQLTRLVSLLMVVLLLTFGAVYKITDDGESTAFAPEVALAFFALFTFAASYCSRVVRDYFNVTLRVLCYLTALWFITLSALNNFLPNYAVGLLFILPGLGVGYSVTVRKIGQLVTFFGVTVLTASIACLRFAGSGIEPTFFAVSLVCISLVTLFVAAARLDAEKLFHASEERYQAVVQQASDGIYLLEADTQTFLDANPAFCRMIGWSRSELRGRKFSDLLANAAPVDFDLSGTTRAHVTERTLRRADGSEFCAELRIDRIRYADRHALSVVVQDVSKRKEYERRLVIAKENAEEIARFKSTLLANMSHEIRTPLCSILGWTAVLSEEIPDVQRELVHLIEQSGRRLHHTLDSVLELAHLDANVRSMQPILVDVSEEVRAVASSKQVLAEKKGLTLDVTDFCSDAFTRIDVSCFRRVLNHLIDNAVKFTDRGGVSVSVHGSGADFRVEIRDTGVGISDEFLPSIFEDFKQESDGLNRDHEGNGLGLAIVKRLVDLMGCRIEVQSRRGEGTTFVIVLPRESKKVPRTRVA